MTPFTEHLPTTVLDVVPTSVTAAWGEITIKVQARNVRFIDAAAQTAEPNAWCYVRAGSTQEYAPLMDNYLGPILNVRKGHPLKVAWVNMIPSMPPMTAGESRMLDLPPINNFAMPELAGVAQFKSMNDSIGVVTHLHGGKVQPHSDGWPLWPASFESNPFHMPSHRVYTYPNEQRAAMLWFHDHGMDNTAQQVFAGLAGLYFVRDESDEEIFQLIGDETQEIPLVIQDRVFDAAVSSVDYRAGLVLAADGKSFDRPEFLGDTIVVNGRPWPVAHAHPLVYRLRTLNGSNARTYALALVDPSVQAAITGNVWCGDRMTVIGNEAGLFREAKALAPQDYLLLAPGERLDILLDLTNVNPAVVASLRLINLAVQGYMTGAGPEPIFQMDSNSVVAPPTPYFGSALSAVPQSWIMEFGMHPLHPRMMSTALDTATLNKILALHSDDESFKWDASSNSLVAAQPGATIANNRLIFCMNDTKSLAKNNDPAIRRSDFTNTPWRDTQLWEMQTPTNKSAAAGFNFPFDASLTDATKRGSISANKEYQVARALFFEPQDPTPPHAVRADDPLWRLATQNSNPAEFPPKFEYAQLYQDNPGEGRSIMKPKAGSYEYWYVANIGNPQPCTDTAVPDMHPFHIHLVNFVVKRRWKLQGTPGVFVEMKDAATGQRPLDFDGAVRHDLVRIQSNEMVELLVHFPKGYTGNYPYHCHLVEHEDMGMMLHFELVP
jgi:FtsP/CotA-like multicopper oxidase with cupredoxin domain